MCWMVHFQARIEVHFQRRSAPHRVSAVVHLQRRSKPHGVSEIDFFDREKKKGRQPSPRAQRPPPWSSWVSAVVHLQRRSKPHGVSEIVHFPIRNEVLFQSTELAGRPAQPRGCLKRKNEMDTNEKRKNESEKEIIRRYAQLTYIFR